MLIDKLQSPVYRALGTLVALLSFALPASAAVDDVVKCARYKVYYIDPAAQFFTPPVPLEDYAEFIFCTEHANLDEIRLKLKKMKPIRSQADAGAGRIKVVPRGRPEDAMVFCTTGEITYRGKQYRLDRRLYEPSLLSIREEGDRQRSLAIEKEDAKEYRDPASITPPAPVAPAAAVTPNVVEAIKASVTEVTPAVETPRDN